MDLWPCTKCGAPGVRNLGVDGWCAVHLEHLYATFDPSTFALHGVGIQYGPLWPEFGPAHCEVRCNVCSMPPATWVGVPGEPCPWCRLARQRMAEWQAEIVLRPPEHDPDDEGRERALTAWAQRLWVAVTAGLITEREAERALSRETRVRAA